MTSILVAGSEVSYAPRLIRRYFEISYLMPKNRSRLEIVVSMLEAVKDNGVSRYSIRKQTNSSWAELKKYLKSLTEIGFVETDVKEHQVLYRASERGRDFLKQYYILLEMMLNKRA